MKKLWVIGIVLISTLGVSAQVEFGVKAGVGFSTLSGPSEMRLAYKVGVESYIPLTRQDNWTFNPGLFFAAKGMNFKGFYGKEQIVRANLGTYLDYLEMPLYIAYSLKFGRRMPAGIFFKAGPYIAYGLIGKTQIEVPDFENFRGTFGTNHFAGACDYDRLVRYKETETVTMPPLHRFDAGLGVAVDFVVRHLTMGMECTYGLTPLCADMFLGAHPRNVMCIFNVGYRF
ncbi:outer membrane protein beta-barrel domain protein [Bacteroidetes bacterium oral taxon 272 str. F0290]|uniref:porin family protein n=1 Tax=Phocaeicola abscessus TaxID=555313 RepID=UPI000385A14F|nr:porin family protein [Phocaeicola abscessus]EPT34735.1 outer membrane protein beta-barrel domain protein [Bacteroidetes bacterium oral taxon 272 str. F0290]